MASFASSAAGLDTATCTARRAANSHRQLERRGDSSLHDRHSLICSLGFSKAAPGALDSHSSQIPNWHRDSRAGLVSWSGRGKSESFAWEASRTAGLTSLIISLCRRPTHSTQLTHSTHVSNRGPAARLTSVCLASMPRSPSARPDEPAVSPEGDGPRTFPTPEATQRLLVLFLLQNRHASGVAFPWGRPVVGRLHMRGQHDRYSGTSRRTCDALPPPTTDPLLTAPPPPPLSPPGPEPGPTPAPEKKRRLTPKQLILTALAVAVGVVGGTLIANAL